jgi:hypothetical protein
MHQKIERDLQRGKKISGGTSNWFRPNCLVMPGLNVDSVEWHLAGFHGQKFPVSHLSQIFSKK